ncbi:phosphatase 2C, partial [Linderina pennispora]
MADTPTTAAEAVNETQNSNIIAPGLTDVANQQEPPPLPQLATAVDKDGADAAGTTPTAIELRVTTNIDDDGEMQESNSSTQQPVPVTQTASLLSNGTIAARPKMQRNPVPPPIDTENANRDAENSLRSKLLLEVESAEALSGNTADTDTGDAVAELPADASQGAPAAISNNATPHQQTDPATDGAEPALAHIGVSFNKNRRYRRSMEDAHFHRYDFDGVTGQALMAIFDGHAGRQAAQWCGDNFESVFIELRQANPEISIPELLNNVFVETDRRIAELYKQSGTTVVVCFLQVAEDNTRTLYTANAGDARAVLSRN